MAETNSPQFSMYARNPVHKHLETPGPNTYHLPPLIGSHVPHKKASCAYTMPLKPQPTPHADTPGPASYNPHFTYKRNNPKYSMTSRPKVVVKGSPGPGPAKYLPVIKDAVHGGSFGLRTTQQPYITVGDEVPSRHFAPNHNQIAYRENEAKKITL